MGKMDGYFLPDMVNSHSTPSQMHVTQQGREVCHAPAKPQSQMDVGPECQIEGAASQENA